MTSLTLDLSLLENAGAIVRDQHFLYTSGRHGKHYINKDAIYPHTDLTEKVVEALASLVSSMEFDAVLAPAVGAILLGHGVAKELTRHHKRPILSVYAESTPEKNFVIKRGYDQLIKEKKVLIVEDILTTGSSVKKVVEAARKIPCEIVGVIALCNRGQVSAKDLGPVPFLKSLLDLSFESWEASECPLCQKGIPFYKGLGKA